MSAEQDEAAVGSVTAEERAAWREWTHFNNENSGIVTGIQILVRRLLADLDAAENIARLAEESEAGWRREADELAERLAAVSALADEWEATGPAWIDPPIGAATELRAALTTTPTPAAEVGRREESGR